jgi:hypothetical protein
MQFKTRSQASLFLSECGIKCSPATLAKLASIGGGPEMVKFGGRVLYTDEALETWISKRAVVRRDTSDPGRCLNLTSTTRCVA